MTTGLLTTAAGRNAIIADLGGGADLVLTHVAWGDANGVPYNPNEAQVALVNEKYRATIASVAVVGGAIVVDAVIPADTNDGSGRPSHGFSVAEVGLFSSAGTLIGVARCGNGYKPPPSSGQAHDVTYRLKLAVANPSAITVVIDPVAQVNVGRHVRPFWLVVDGVVNDPPGVPVLGATYAIADAPTGAWAGFPGRLAQWVGVWALASVPIGHVVCDNSKGAGDAARFMRRTAASWVGALASETEVGFALLATDAEAVAGSSKAKAVHPSGLRKAIDAAAATLQVFPHVNGTGAMTVTGSAGQVVLGAAQSWVHRGLKVYNTDNFTLADRTFVTVANATYHLRWYAPGHANAPVGAYPNGRLMLRSVGDFAYNPSSALETDQAFDTSYDDMLIARVVTSAGNVPTVTALLNLNRLSHVANTTAQGASNSGTGPETPFTLNWSRQPQSTLRGFFSPGDAYYYSVNINFSVQPTRYGFTVRTHAIRSTDGAFGGGFATTYYSQA